MSDLPNVPNYGASFAPPSSPQAAFTQGLGVANNADAMIQANRQAQEARQAAADKAAADAARQTQVHALIAKINSPQGTAEDRANLTLLVSPDQAKSLQTTFDGMDKDKLRAGVKDSMEMFASFDQNHPDVAIARMKQQAEARRADGDIEGAKMLDTWAEIAVHDPQAAKNWLGGIIPLSADGKDAMQSYLDQRKSPHDINNTDADTLLKLAQARKLELDALKPGGVDMTPTQINNRDQAVLDAVKGRSLATQYESIAQNMAKVPLTGTAAQLAEQAKKIFGSEDAVTAIKTEFERLKTSGVLSMLPPGSASDRDIEIARGAFPSSNANPKVIADFMQRLARLKRFDANVSDAQAEWATMNGGLGNARSEFTVNGKTVKPGMKFSDFVAKNIGYEGGTVSAPAGNNSGTGKPVEVDF